MKKLFDISKIVLKKSRYRIDNGFFFYDNNIRIKSMNYSIGVSIVTRTVRL
jgi:hypothetical protein